MRVDVKPDSKANREIATTALQFTATTPEPLEKVHTPSKKTIDEVATFLGVEPSQTAKAVFYSMPSEDGRSAVLVLAVIRGDIEVNEIKLKNHLKSPKLDFANDAQILKAGSVPGYASPIGLDPTKVRIVFDPSAQKSSNLVVGANETDQHYRNFNFSRDLSPELQKAITVIDIATAREGDPCPVTGQPLQMKRGIEVGNIFQLGTKYSEAMNCTFLDRNGKSKAMIMGCYGIGVGRAIASVIEQSHDDFGPIWPISIAPYQVHLVALNFAAGDSVDQTAQTLYKRLLDQGVEVLWDDRNEKAGSAFKDADLIGIPIRVIVAPKSLAEGNVEIKTRNQGINERVPSADCLARVLEIIAQEKAKYV